MVFQKSNFENVSIVSVTGFETNRKILSFVTLKSNNFSSVICSPYLYKLSTSLNITVSRSFLPLGSLGISGIEWWTLDPSEKLYTKKMLTTSIAFRCLSVRLGLVHYILLNFHYPGESWYVFLGSPTLHTYRLLWVSIPCRCTWSLCGWRGWIIRYFCSKFDRETLSKNLEFLIKEHQKVQILCLLKG